MGKSIKRLFIANRGEILRRIATTAKNMDIETVAITDRASPPQYLLGLIDHFVEVEHETTAVYLDGAQIIQWAKEHQADAIHPGFGFLSENDEFAKAVVDAGLIWVGPHAKAISLMASKAEARTAAEKAQVPCIPGLQDFHVPENTEGDFSELEKFAKKIGYPLLIKAAYGGGGKGMRLVEKEEELKENALRAHSEAINSFGNGELICERYLGTPRHVEVQVLADKHGQVHCIGDRDCSMQRRHQKVIEEAPAPFLSDKTRTAMHQAAKQLASGVGYDSTGTVEFLVDWSEKAQKSEQQEFYFLEMNTRLQVEHPVTEEVFGLDLVEWQLKVAQGEQLPADLDDREPRGHSIEVRLYAEDVEQNYFPSPGVVSAFFPFSAPGIRWETGLDCQDVISDRFDPMIAKLIATGQTRKAAIARLSQALEHTFFAGPSNNLEFISHLLTRTGFAEAPVNTNWLTAATPGLVEELNKRRQEYEPIADQVLGKLRDNLLTGATSAGQSISQITDYAFGGSAAKDSTIGQSFNVSFGDLQNTNQKHQAGRGTITLESSEADFWHASSKSLEKREFWTKIKGFTYHQELLSSGSYSQAAQGSDDEVVSAPVPGKVIAVKISTGEQVDANQALFVLESMKMEFEVKASKGGTIAQVSVQVGDQVTAGQELAQWQTEE